MTCWRRLRDWQEAGIWQLIHFAALDWLARSETIDWSCAVLDGSSIRAVFGGQKTGPNPTDRAKLGSKRHLICIGFVVTCCGLRNNGPQRVVAKTGDF